MDQFQKYPINFWTFFFGTRGVWVYNTYAMQYLELFIIRYFILICICVVLFITSIQRFKQHSRLSVCMILIASLALLLSAANILEQYGKDSCNIPLTTIFAFIGYIFRPVFIYLFAIMSGLKLTKKSMILAAIPLLLNFLVFCLAFIPQTKNLVFYFFINDESTMSFGGGYLRYASHIIALLYLGWIVFISVKKLKAKHVWHAISVLSCAVFLILAVVIETFFNNDGNVFLLNSTVGVSALEYYLYLYTEKTQYDSLTGLYNRETYFHDIPRMEKTITGVVQFDLNGLKYINDNFGHTEGDEALSTVSKAISQCTKNGMYVYRLGGDEFILLANECKEEEIVETIDNFKEALSLTAYYCSVGYAYRESNSGISLEELTKEAEKNMYQAKNAFYKNSPFERRKI